MQTELDKLPGSRPGTPGAPEVVKSNVEIMSEKWTDAGDTDGKLGVLFEMLVKTMKGLEGFQVSAAPVHNPPSPPPLP